MQRVPVDSSTFVSIGYDEETATLETEFVSGAVYQYFGVPAAEHAALLQADSIGGYFNAHIRNIYPFRLVSEAA